MTTIQTADGRLLRSSRPAAASPLNTGPSISLFSQARWEDPFWQTRSDDDNPWLVSYEAMYRSQPNLSAVVDKLARHIATLPFDAYRQLDNHGRERVASTDGLASLLARPLPRMSKVHLLAHIAQSMLIHGNALVAKLRGPDRDTPPIMLWPLDWSQVSAYGPQGGRIEWWSTRQFDGVERFMPVEDTLLFAWPAPSGGEIGVSPLEKLGVTLRLEDAAQRHQTSMFRNGVRPSNAITLPGDPKAETLQIVRDAIERLHKGVDKSGKTMLLAGGATIAPLSMTPVEAALIEQRNLNLGEIGRVYDLSGPVMNDLEHGTYSNVQVLLDALYRDVVPVWLGLTEQTFQAQLIDPEPAWIEKFTAFDLTDKLKGDPVQLAQSLKLQVDAGLITRNEARRILNMPPIGDPNDARNPANQLTVMANNQAPLDSIGNDPPPPPPS